MKKPRTLSQLRAHPWVSEIDEEFDNGYWLYLKNGYWSPEMESTTLHEMTVKTLCDVFSRVVEGSPE